MIRVQIFSFLFVILFAFNSFGQSNDRYAIEGTVMDAETGETLPFASVFLANTTIGTVSNESGFFELNITKSGSYDLIIKFAGYKTFARSVQLFQPQVLKFEVKLAVETRFVGGVTVTAKKDEEWKRNLVIFKENFLGTSEFAQRCKIINEEVIGFFFDRDKNIFEAYAQEPLIIENKALGYRLKYVLEDFRILYNDRYTTYSGFPTFSDLKEGREPRKAWQRNREIAYNGSLDHFFSSLFKGTLKEEGYVIQMAKDDDGKRILYKTELNLNDYVVPGTTPNSKRLVFENILYVTYTKEFTEGSTQPRSRSLRLSINPMPGRGQLSQIFLVAGKTFIEFESNGYVYNPLDYLVSSHWAYEKVGELMPINYVSTKNN